MQSLENILVKFTATPGECNLSELRRLKTFLSGMQKKVTMFSKNTGTEPTTVAIELMMDHATLCYETHENYKGE